MKAKLSHALVALSLGLVLAGCGDETPPTENEFTQAIGMRPGQVTGTVCKRAKDKPGFKCDFLNTYSGVMTWRRVVKEGDGWRDVSP